MKNKELARTLKFILFSASAGIIETVAMILCEEVIKIPGHYVCYTIALVLSVLWNFTFNRKFTFQSAENVPKAMFLVFLFYIPFAPFTIARPSPLTASAMPTMVSLSPSFTLSSSFGFSKTNGTMPKLMRFAR